MAPGALSHAAQTWGEDDSAGENKDNQFLNVGSISPEYLNTQQWGTLCAIAKALGQEFWESEVGIQTENQTEPNKAKPDQTKPNRHSTPLYCHNHTHLNNNAFKTKSTTQPFQIYHHYREETYAVKMAEEKLTAGITYETPVCLFSTK